MRDRASYAFALVSVAAALELSKTAASATCGWRWAASPTSRGGRAKAEAALRGDAADEAHFRRAAEAELADARGRSTTTRFKIELAKRTIVGTSSASLAGERMR